jgi:hypothetical protein
MAFAQDDDLSDARVLGHGPSVDYLDAERTGPKRRTWKQTTRWIDVSETLALTEVARQMIESLWLLARNRYAGGPPPVKLFAPLDITPASFRSSNRGPAQQPTMPVGIDEHL